MGGSTVHILKLYAPPPPSHDDRDIYELESFDGPDRVIPQDLTYPRLLLDPLYPSLKCLGTGGTFQGALVCGLRERSGREGGREGGGGGGGGGERRDGGERERGRDI